jgi:zinc D-Ala-D-Ala carboxypeptidase
MENISTHMTYAEATHSDTAKRLGIDNIPNDDQLKRMKLVAEKVFEPIRVHFNVPIYISSFFRSSALNVALGGAINSQHMLGEAIDADSVHSHGIENKQIFDWVKDNLEFDQLIAEDIKKDGSLGWVHISYKENGNRHQVLSMVIKDGKKFYEEII